MQAQELLKIRKSLKMSRPVFAEESGISKRMLQYYEAGTHEIGKCSENSILWVAHTNKWRKKLTAGKKDAKN